jgi:putative porin
VVTRKLTQWAGVCALAAALGAASAAPAAGEEPVIEDVLQILKERGLVDDGQYNELLAKHQSWETKNGPLLGRIEFSGDLRLRYENFWFDEDEFGVDRSNRNRLRYRLRIGGKAAINDYFDAVFRLGSGENDHRSNNRTLGFDPDFGPDDIFIDQAYLAFKAPKEWFPGASFTATGGKVQNPFFWKGGKFDLLWDGDINPEGIGLQLGYKPGEALNLFANGGYFIVKENGSNVDPHVLGLQAGAIWSAGEQVELGARLAWYSWRSLDEAFFTRAASFGTIRDGLTEGAPTNAAGAYNTGDLAVYLRLDGIEDWPILVYGQIAKNFDAQSSDLFGSAGKEDLGWGLGVEVGDKKKLFSLGVGYFALEANFWPAQYTDSDLLDGFTNRKGWAFYVSKEILPNTELGVQLFVSDEIRPSTSSFATSLSGSDRVRLQTDLLVKF